MEKSDRLKYQQEYQSRYQQLKRDGFNKSFRDKGVWHIGCSKCKVFTVGEDPSHAPNCPNDRVNKKRK